MASLRKDPRGFSKYWYACITVPGKGQTQRCTKVLATERNRGEALSVAERWEREAKHLGPAIHLENRAAVFEAFVSFTQKTIAGEAIFWGQDDIFFTREGGEAYLSALPDAEMHRLEAGHFAVEDCLEYISGHIKLFCDRKVGTRSGN